MAAAVELRRFAATIPAGTAQASPVTVDLSIPSRIVTGVRLRVPPGPSGLVGFALASGGTHILPWGDTSWIVADDEVIDEDLANQIESGAWQLIGYNTGSYDHTIQVVFRLLPISTAAATSVWVPATITAPAAT